MPPGVVSPVYRQKLLQISVLLGTQKGPNKSSLRFGDKNTEELRRAGRSLCLFSIVGQAPTRRPQRFLPPGSRVSSMMVRCICLLNVATLVAVPKCALIMTKVENNNLVLGEMYKQPLLSTWHQAPTQAKSLKRQRLVSGCNSQQRIPGSSGPALSKRADKSLGFRFSGVLPQPPGITCLLFSLSLSPISSGVLTKPDTGRVGILSY